MNACKLIQNTGLKEGHLLEGKAPPPSFIGGGLLIKKITDSTSVKASYTLSGNRNRFPLYPCYFGE